MDNKDTKHLFTRRNALQAGAAGAGLFVAGGIARSAGPDCVRTPAQTEGPYWVDERLNRSDIRSDPDTGDVRVGLPFRVAMNVSEYASSGCSPVAGCYVDVWHCDALGAYSDVGGQVGEKWLRGYQVTDAHGNVRFISIYPGYYPGRTPHIHFRVRKFDANGNTVFNFVSQMYFDDTVTDGIYAREAPYNGRPSRNTRNNNDGIYNAACLMRLSDNTTHAVASFNVVIDAESGLANSRGTPTDEDSMEHLHDFGGGTPPLRLA